MATTWSIELRHDGLSAYRVIRGRDRNEVEQKAAMQQRAWEARWAQVQAHKQVRDARERFVFGREQQRAQATAMTIEAERVINDLRATLATGLHRNPIIEFEALEDHAPFPISRPASPVPHTVAPKPDREAYASERSLIDYLIPTIRRQKEQATDDAFMSAMQQWTAYRDGVHAVNAELERAHEQKMKQWAGEREAFTLDQEEHNAGVRRFQQDYLARQPEAITEYCDHVLSASPYPDYFPRSAELFYAAEENRLLVDYDLPGPDSLPRLKEVKFSPTKGLVEHDHTPLFLQKLYDDVLYQISLRTILELFTADRLNAITSIAFNGWVSAVDKRTGKDTYSPIMSLHVTRDEFNSLDLSRVDPKACFRQLKGVASTKLAELAAIRPIVQINRNDQRFVPGHDVAVEEGANLAAMDWEDFEHLIRELFEQEFSSNGGEVHITRASRDAGVDAIAFDPDPIRGGKIVIQAKRYTNTVDLSAVRDLYGTVHNEGATKGILVTTADFGSDAYEFVKDKPLTLLNGSHLLYLLAKHGRHARIDLHEARKALQGQPRQPHTKA